MAENHLRLKVGLAEMLKGGVIMDVTNAEQARIAEDAGAVAVMALERVPADIRAEGGVARMASPKKIREIMTAVTIPVMAKVRIGHFVEAQILQELRNLSGHKRGISARSLSRHLATTKRRHTKAGTSCVLQEIDIGLIKAGPRVSFFLRVETSLEFIFDQ